MENNFQLEFRMRQRVDREPNNIMARFCLPWLVAVIICVTTLPSSAGQSPPESVVDRIVAIVNNDIVLQSEVEKALAPYLDNIKKRGLPEETEARILDRARKDILDNLINEKLSTQKAADLGIRVGDEEVDEALDQMKKSMLFSEKAFAAYLSEIGYTLDEYREQTRKQIIKSKLLGQEIKSKIVVTREEIEDYFQKHPEEFTPGTWYHLKHIIMLTPAGMDPADRAAVRAKMEEIHRQIKAGAPFEIMANQYSQSSVADKGGDLGRFTEADLAPEIKEVVINTKEGDITPVIETDFGYQIFYVQSVIKNDGSLDEDAADRIHKKIYDEKLDEKFNAWIEELRDSAHIQIIE